MDLPHVYISTICRCARPFRPLSPSYRYSCYYHNTGFTSLVALSCNFYSIVFAKCLFQSFKVLWELLKAIKIKILSRKLTPQLPIVQLHLYFLIALLLVVFRTWKVTYVNKWAQMIRTNNPRPICPNNIASKSFGPQPSEI